ncbi:MAG TPA: ABC transporter ATP-binding protein, partial [Terracidiphilus sp.]
LLDRPVGTREIRARVGFLPEHFRFYDWLSATELVSFHGKLCGVPERILRRRVPLLLERVGLSAHRSKPLRSFSKGMMQRVGLAQAIVNDPDILFLDEPTSGLDPAGRKLVREVIREERARGATVFLNSHLLGEVEKSCDRVAFIREGTVVGMYAMGAWQAGHAEVEIVTGGLNPASLALLSAINGLTITAGDGTTLRLRVPDENSLPEVVRCLVETGVRVFSVIPQRISLEELFLQTMGPDQGL